MTTSSKKSPGYGLQARAGWVICAAAVLSACGGGGGGSSPSLPPFVPAAAVDAAATVSVAPADGATGVRRDGAVVTVTPSITAGTFTSNTSTAGLVCNGVTIVSADQAMLAGQVLTLNPGATNMPPYGATCVAQGQVVASGVNAGKSATVAWKTTFTIESAPVTANGCVAPQVDATVGPFHVCASPMGTTVAGSQFKQLPAGCTSVYATPMDPTSGFSACWRDFVTAGNVSWVQTSAMMTGLTGMDGSPDPRATRPMIFGGFVGSAGKYQMRQFFADTGELLSSSVDIDVQWIASGINSVTGNQLGYLLSSGSPASCMQWYFDLSTNGMIGVGIWHFGTLDVWADKLPGVTAPTCSN